MDVNWDDAKSYVGWLSRKTGERYRLLSEAEWEYAARAGTTGPLLGSTGIGPIRRTMTGTTPTAGRGGVPEENHTRVGSFSANGFGLHDVHGNVWEWVEDCWHDSYAGGAPTDGSAWVSGGDCDRRVLRGGSWSTPRYIPPLGEPQLDSAGNRNDGLGFRVSRTLTP